MENELVSSVGRLRKSAALLNQITDRASDTVREVEAFLNKECSVGVHGFVQVRESTDPESGVTFTLWLEYRRVGSRYRIAVVKSMDTGPDDEDVKAWSDASRDEKLETVAKLPELIIEIAQKLEKKIGDAEKVVQSLDQLLGTLAGKAGR